MFDALQPQVFWFILGLALLLAELALPGFVIIFFGIGAWVTTLAIWLGWAESFTTQLLIFLVSSILSLVLFRKQGKNYFQGRVSRKVDDVTALDDVKGERAVVVEDILPTRLSGKVELHGTRWDATSDQEIHKGALVEILQRDNLTLKVKPL